MSDTHFLILLVAAILITALQLVALLRKPRIELPPELLAQTLRMQRHGQDAVDPVARHAGFAQAFGHVPGEETRHGQLVAELQGLDQAVQRVGIAEHSFCAVEGRRVAETAATDLALRGRQGAAWTARLGQAWQVGLATGAEQTRLRGCAAQQAGLRPEPARKFQAVVKPGGCAV